jgi:hypothetical protein
MSPQESPQPAVSPTVIELAPTQPIDITGIVGGSER